ncbi:Metal-dependent hydrolase [Pseudoalteromonas luteoviolacea B = ATCC 29581]|nr:Metal-dependent hydrolase [Pseudoalteromonas luteoviolacea B = ATCC 29581]
MKISKILLLSSLLLLGACKNELVTTSASSNQTLLQPNVSIATWNVEHLSAPIENGCKPRTIEQLIAMQQYVARIDADVFALQEVASESAVRLLFPENDWTVILSERPDSGSYVCRGSERQSTQQKVAFAIKKSLPVVEQKSVEALGLNMEGLRFGLQLTIEDQHGLINILNVHLKSGCFVKDYQAHDSEACQIFAKQVPLIENWIDEQIKRGDRFVILGDFNHRLASIDNAFAQRLFKHTRNLVNTTSEVTSCHPRYKEPIDHILLGYKSDQLGFENPQVHLFNDMNEDAMLSDHCALSVEIAK